MDEVTPAQVRQAVIDQGISRYKLRECSICHAPLFYLFSASQVAFDASCDCCREPLQLHDYDDVARCFNIQAPDIRAKLWAEFTASGTAKAAAE